MKTISNLNLIKQASGLVVVLFMGIGVLSAQSHSYSIDDSKIALEGYSPVSYIDMGKAELGNKKHKSTFDGVAYYFTNRKQKETFDANPAKYKPQYGGWCAFAVSLGAKFQPDPSRFRVVHGKLYMFTRNVEGDFVKVWEKDGRTKHITQADKNWKTMEKFKS